jgi:oxygen-independent coproporphyrinogen-3 oxidase
VFFGGGTPSLFSARSFERLLKRLEPQLAADAEITLEANPGTLEHKPLDAYRGAGINRLSLGVQSFDPDQLRSLGRIHSPEDVYGSFASARRAGFDNINLDLMYALPEQTVAAACADLEAALELEPEHLSWYQLTLEPKTEFYARPPKLPDEDTVAAMEEAGRRRLAAEGFERYEVSAYAQPGREARHNLNYWRFGDYLGIGAGAHGKLTHAGTVLRTEKPPQPRRYLADPLALSSRTVAGELLAGEYLLNALRLKDGTTFADFEARTGLDSLALAPRWQHWVALDALRADRLAATELGFAHLDRILKDFIP